jgi:hypothetical protein
MEISSRVISPGHGVPYSSTRSLTNVRPREKRHGDSAVSKSPSNSKLKREYTRLRCVLMARYLSELVRFL